jgi:hypothetical protein
VRSQCHINVVRLRESMHRGQHRDQQPDEYTSSHATKGQPKYIHFYNLY